MSPPGSLPSSKTCQSAEEFVGLGKDVLGGFISNLRSGKSGAEDWRTP